MSRTIAFALWGSLVAASGCGQAVSVDAGEHDAGIDAAGIDAGERDAGIDAAIDDAAIDASSEDAALDASADDAAIDAPIADAGSDATLDDASTDVDGGPCGTTIRTHPVEPSPHVTECSPVTYSTRPGTSGPHYPRWAAYQSYDVPIPEGFVVHALEHGAVAIRYRCDTPCDADLAALTAFLAARPPDPRCATTSTPHQIVIAPDPTLDVRFAAAAWGVSMRAECFDLPALGAFLDAHTGHGPEDLCAPGIDPTDPRWAIPANCGE